MPASVEYVPSRRGWQAMANGPEAFHAVTDAAETAKAWCEADAQTFRETGEYAGSFEVVPSVLIDIGNRPRAAALLRNTSKHAAAVEWGNEQTNGNGHRVLGRMLDALTVRRRR